VGQMRCDWITDTLQTVRRHYQRRLVSPVPFMICLHLRYAVERIEESDWDTARGANIEI
jgi:hypothetical protein